MYASDNNLLILKSTVTLFKEKIKPTQPELSSTEISLIWQNRWTSIKDGAEENSIKEAGEIRRILMTSFTCMIMGSI